MENLFAYGTLMSEDIFEAVTGIRRKGLSAVLAGFRRWSVEGEPYPAIVADEAGVVDGVIYSRIPEAVWRKLDRYEGRQYVRQAVAVNVDNGARLAAGAYVWSGSGGARLDRPHWRFSDFLKHCHADYLDQLR